MKWNSLHNRIAGDVRAYVDDLRVLGWDVNHAWLITRQIASRLQYLGVQDAPRKRRLDNGPWAGTVYISTENAVQKTVTLEKWSKAKSYINQLNMLRKDVQLDYKFLEKVRGYLCHMAMTYDTLFPYLKGLHLTLSSHLPKRDENGWKLKDLEWIAYLQIAKENGIFNKDQIHHFNNFVYNPKDHPKLITPVPRFYSCLEALTLFFKSDSPPVVTERSTNIHLAIYGFCDASKSGFGASVQHKDGLHYRIGTWGADEDDESSNFREFTNLIESLEADADQGKLSHSTFIMATDNSTVESAIYKGNSSSEKLFNLVMRFHALKFKTGSIFLVTHVAGECMKKQGTDGISRGCLVEGVAVGQAMLNFCPWGKSALDRSPTLETWCRNTFSSKLEVLSPKDWFSRDHDHLGGFYDHQGWFRLKLKPGIFLWHPPPAADDAAIEQLRKARLKRRDSTHLVVIPRVVTPLWLKQLYKTCDLVLFIPPKYEFWNSDMFEPLTLAFVFPFLNRFPWQLRSTPKLLASRREMQSLLQTDHMDPRDILRKFFSSTSRLPSLPARLVRKLLFYQQ